MKQILNRKILLITGIILFLLFILYSYLVAKEIFTQSDFDLTVKLQDKIPARFDYPFSWFSVLGSAEITGIIWFIILIIMAIKRFWKAVLALFLLPLALAMEVFGKLFVHHPSPPYLFYKGVLDVNFPLHFTHTDYSYPSGHETRTAFLIAFLALYFLYRHSKRTNLIIQPILFGILIIMTISRVYLGEHWTTDVIGGFLIGISFGILAGIMIPGKAKSVLHDSGAL